MSMRPQRIQDIPEETQRVAQTAFPKGNVYMKMRDELGTFFQDDEFVDLFAPEGQPAFSPWRLALICVMQFAENLTDRQTAEAVRARIDWKYALSLELTDPGFDYSILSEFRQRLLDSERQERLLTIMLQRFQELKLLKSGGRQRTDSTHILGAVRLLNRLEMIGETLHHTLNVIAEVAPVWLRQWVPSVWYERYGKPFTEYRLPLSDTERDELALTIGQDGWHLLETVYVQPQTPGAVRELAAVKVLRQVWVQQYYQDEQGLHWRSAKALPPCSLRLQSPYEVEERYSTKGSSDWVGYKVHLTETCNEEGPHLITHVETSMATQQDVDVVDKIHQDLQQLHCLPDQHIVDTGYSSAALIVDSQQQYGVELVCPLRPERGWQAAQQTGFDVRHFQIDWENQVAICPMGKRSSSWTPCPPRRGHAIFFIKFRAPDCKACAVRDQCTKATRRTISLPEQPLYEAVQQHRQKEQTEAFQETYHKRAGIEGTISQAAFALGMRRSRYRSHDKTHLQHVLTAAAINLTRTVNWLTRRVVCDQ